MGPDKRNNQPIVDFNELTAPNPQAGQTIDDGLAMPNLEIQKLSLLRSALAIPSEAGTTSPAREMSVTALAEKHGEDPTVQAVLAGISLSNDEPDIRSAALFAIQQANPDLATIVQLVGMQHTEAWDRMFFLEKSAEISPALAINQAIEMVENDPDERVRIEALETLLDLDTQKAKVLIDKYASAETNLPDLQEYALQLQQKELIEVLPDEELELTSGVWQSADKLRQIIFANSEDLALKYVDDFLQNCTDQEALTLGMTLESHPNPALRRTGLEIFDSFNHELALLVAEGRLGDSDSLVAEKARQIISHADPEHD